MCIRDRCINGLSFSGAASQTARGRCQQLSPQYRDLKASLDVYKRQDLEGDGAFICQNSWGSSFGDNGVFYVSYYDTNVGTHNVVSVSYTHLDVYKRQEILCAAIDNGRIPEI